MNIKNLKLNLPVTVLLTSIILGGFFYASQLIKQRSIERQQENQLLQEREERCQKFAAQRNSEIEKEDPHLFFSVFEYHFNPDTLMCILAHKEFSTSLFSPHYVVTDLFTGEVIYENSVNYRDKEEDLDKEWRDIADLYFYQKEVRIP